MSIGPVQNNAFLIAPRSNRFAGFEGMPTAEKVVQIAHRKRSILAGDRSVYLEALLLDFIGAIKNPEFLGFPTSGLKIACDTIAALAANEAVREFPYAKRIAWSEGLYNDVLGTFRDLSRFLDQKESMGAQFISTTEIRTTFYRDSDGRYIYIGVNTLCSEVEENKKENISKRKTAEFSSLVLELVGYIRSSQSEKETWALKGYCEKTKNETWVLKRYCEKILILLSNRDEICQFSCDKIEWDSIMIDLTKGLCKDLFEFLRENDTISLEDLDYEEFGLNEFCDLIEVHQKGRSNLG